MIINTLNNIKTLTKTQSRSRLITQRILLNYIKNQKDNRNPCQSRFGGNLSCEQQFKELIMIADLIQSIDNFIYLHSKYLYSSLFNQYMRINIIGTVFNNPLHFAILLILIANVNSISSHNPILTSSSYFRADNKAIITQLTGNTVTPTFAITYSSAFDNKPSIAYGIKRYEANDRLRPERFRITRLTLSKTGFSGQVKLIEVTNILNLAVSYLAVDPAFPHHLNSFDNVPLNYSGNLNNISNSQQYARSHTEVINYSDQASDKKFSQFSTPLANNKVLMFLTTLELFGWNQQEFVFTNSYRILNSSHYALKVQVNSQSIIFRIHFSLVIFDQQEVTYYKNYQIVHEVNLALTGEQTISLAATFYPNFIMGLSSFEAPYYRTRIFYEWQFFPQQNKIKIKSSQSFLIRQNEYALTNKVSTIFYIKKRSCPDTHPFYNMTSDKCQDDCAEYYLRNTTLETCISCHYSCLRCTGTSSNQCSACDSTRDYRTLEKSSCLCQKGYGELQIPNSVCSDCTLKVTRCQSCTFDASNNVKCTSCANGFYPSSFISCIACNTNIPGCQLCTDNGQCTKCSASGYFLDDDDDSEIKTCKPCAQRFSNCLNCNSQICYSCAQNYLWDNQEKQCKKCNNFVQNCEICKIDPGLNYNSPTLVCLQCMKQQGEPSSPLLYPSKSRLNCVECSQRIQFCKQCALYDATTGAVKCLNCQPQFYYPTQDQYSCALCPNIQNCVKCPNQHVCKQCSNLPNSEIKLYPNIQQKECKKCQDIISNCLTCEIDQTKQQTICIQCKTSIDNMQMIPSDDNLKCVSCFELTPHCQACQVVNKKSMCVSCNVLSQANEQLFLNQASKTCVSCGDLAQEIIPFCKKCSNSSQIKCIDCNNNPTTNQRLFPNDKGLCTPCDQIINGCGFCLHYIENQNEKTYNVICLSCKKEEGIPTKQHLFLIGSSQKCQSCQKIIPNCNLCRTNQQLEIAQNVQLSNQMINDPTVYCKQCQALYYLDYTTQASCKLCSQFIQKCQKCSQNTDLSDTQNLGKVTCQRCFNNSMNVQLFPDIKKQNCVICSVLIQGCVQCQYLSEASPSAENIVKCVKCRQKSSQLEALYPDQNNKCVPCKKIVNKCISCQYQNSLIVKCLECGTISTDVKQIELYPDQSKQKCVQCSALISNCRSCVRQADRGQTTVKCRQCQNNGVILSESDNSMTIYPSLDKKQCKPCAEQIPNCKLCLYDTITLKCNKCEAALQSSEPLYPNSQDNRSTCALCSQIIQNCKTCKMINLKITCQQCSNNKLDDSLLFPDENKQNCVSCEALVSTISKQQLDCYQTEQGCDQYLQRQCLKGISQFNLEKTQQNIQLGAIVAIAVPAALLIGIIGSSIAVFKKIAAVSTTADEILQTLGQLASFTGKEEEFLVGNRKKNGEQQVFQKIDQLGFMTI